MEPGKTKNITHTIYEAIRCSLVHEANLPFEVTFTERSFFGKEGFLFLIPTRMIVALVLAVTASPFSSGKILDESFGIILDNRQLPINRLMGDATGVRTYLGLSPVL
jgi:hypothetical protein